MAAGATPKKEAAASRDQQALQASAGPQDCRGSRGFKAAKVTRVSEELPGRQDLKETWAPEAFLDSPEPTEFRGTRARAGPGEGRATTAAMGPGVTPAHKAPPARTASPAHSGPKDPRARKANHMHCPERTETDTGANWESLGWLVSRARPAAPGPWGQWAQSEPREDRAPQDPPGQKDSRATEDLVFMEKRGKRVTRASQDPMEFRPTPFTMLTPLRAPPSTLTCIRVKRAVQENQGSKAFPTREKKGSWAFQEHGGLPA